MALIQESLSVATRTGAAKPADFSKVIVDTTVQPKAVAFPTDAKLMHRARERLVKLARKTGVSLRQSYERIGKYALIAHQRYTHAKQFKRANRALKTIRTYLGRVTRDIVRKIKGDAALESVFAHPLMLALRVREQRQHQRGKKIVLFARARGRTHRQGKSPSPLPVARRQGLDRHHAPSLQGRPVHRPAPEALPGNPYDSHTLRTMMPEIETQISANLSRIVTNPGYRGHNAPPDHQFEVISGVRDAASPRRSNANSAAARRSNRSSAMPRPSTAWAETISPEPTATPPTPSSPPPATTFADSSNGWPPFGASSSWRSSPTPGTLRSPRKTVLEVHPTHRRAKRRVLHMRLHHVGVGIVIAVVFSRKSKGLGSTTGYYDESILENVLAVFVASILLYVSIVNIVETIYTVMIWYSSRFIYFCQRYFRYVTYDTHNIFA